MLMKPTQVTIAPQVCVEAAPAVVPGAELVGGRAAKTGQEVRHAAAPRSRAAIAGVLTPGTPIA